VRHPLPPIRSAASVALACFLCAGGAAQAQLAPRFPGGQYEHVVAGGQDYHVLVVDLCAPGVRVRGTRNDERGRVVSSFGGLVGATAAVNGDFFDGGFGTNGPSMGDGALWGGADHTYVSPVAFGRNAVDMPHHANEGGPAPWAEQVVSGHPTLLDDGALVGNPGDPLCTNRHPRTALGLSQDHRTLIVLVVDGRRGGAAGMTCEDMAGVFGRYGAFDALNLDGGGSSTMWLADGGVLNRPSDGRERTVANHLAIIASGAGPSPHCPTPTWRGEFVAQSWPPAHDASATLFAGQVQDGWVELRNTGASPWDANTKLAPTPRDQPSPLAAPAWLAPHRVSSVAAPTPPGQVGRFALPLLGPAPGEYTQTFGLLQEGVAWFADDGGPPDTFITIRVTSVPPPPDAAPPPPDAARSAADATTIRADAGAGPPPTRDGGPGGSNGSGGAGDAEGATGTGAWADATAREGDPAPFSGLRRGDFEGGGCATLGPRPGGHPLAALGLVGVLIRGRTRRPRRDSLATRGRLG
jgi:hypothetical protein